MPCYHGFTGFHKPALAFDLRFKFDRQNQNLKFILGVIFLTVPEFLTHLWDDVNSKWLLSFFFFFF